MKRISNIAFIALLLIIVFVPEAKATVQQGLMKTGLFNPNLNIEKLQDSTRISKLPAEGFKMEVVDKTGRIVSLKDLKGKVVFINFWATWCAPCIAEMPSIQKLYETFKDNDDVAFVILEAEGNKEKADRLLTKKKLTLPVYYPYGTIPTEFFRGRLPTTVILDKEGNMAHITEGMADYSGHDIVDFINEVRAMHP